MAETDFRAQSYDVWQKMAAGWDRDRRFMQETSQAVSEWLVDALDPKPGQTILELAAGTGETGFLAAARIGDDGKLISTDFAPKMVEAAGAESERLGLANVEPRVLDAEDDGSARRQCRRSSLPVGLHAHGRPRGSATGDSTRAA